MQREFPERCGRWAYELERRIAKVEPQFVWNGKWQTALDQITDKKVKETLINFHVRSFQLAMDRLVGGSPVFVVICGGAVIALIIRDGLHNLKRVYDKAARFAVSRVINPKIVEEDAASCVRRPSILFGRLDCTFPRSTPKRPWFPHR